MKAGSSERDLQHQITLSTMQKQLIAVQHKDGKCVVELYHDDKKMTIHFRDGQLEQEFQTTGFSVNSDWRLEIQETARLANGDRLRDFFIDMMVQKHDLCNYFG